VKKEVKSKKHVASKKLKKFMKLNKLTYRKLGNAIGLSHMGAFALVNKDPSAKVYVNTASVVVKATKGLVSFEDFVV